MMLDHAVLEFTDALHNPRAPRWAEMVRARLLAVRESLAERPPRCHDGWLSAREEANEADRKRLLHRLTCLGPAIIDHPESESALHELQRLCNELEHYRQRLHDLAFDDVELELGGSE